MFETIIKKAIEGGYKNSDFIIRSKSVIHRQTHENVNFNQMILDPLFWQSLGKACSWGFVWNPLAGCHTNQNPEQWQDNALKFHEINLTQSFDDAVKYLSELVKEN